MAPRNSALPVVVLLSILAGGCGSKEEADPGAPRPMDLPMAPPPGMGISGTTVSVYLSDRGEERKAYTPEKFRVAALVPNSAGGFTVLAGTTAPDGTFTVPVVPAGTYYLRTEILASDGTWLPGDYFVTSERTIHLGGFYTGRADSARPKTPTTLTVDADNLSPWKKTDSILFYSLGADAFWRLESENELSSLMEGGTRISALALDLSETYGMTLVDSSKGDRLFVTQLVSAMAGSFPYVTSMRVFEPAPFTQAEGQAAAIAGTFQPVPNPQQVSLTWHQTAFAALATDVHPTAGTLGHSLFVEAQPAGPGRYVGGTSAMVLSGFADAETVGSNDQRVDLSYGNPYPASWPLIAQATSMYVVGTGDDTRWAYLETWGPLENLARTPLRPAITPPRVVKVEGPSLTPKISWDAPAVGTPAIYRVEIYQRDSAGNWDLPTWIFTQERSITVPPEVLETGVPYYVGVTARTVHDLKQPFRAFPAGASAQVLTAVMTP